MDTACSHMHIFLTLFVCVGVCVCETERRTGCSGEAATDDRLTSMLLPPSQRCCALNAPLESALLQIIRDSFSLQLFHTRNPIAYRKHKRVTPRRLHRRWKPLSGGFMPAWAEKTSWIQTPEILQYFHAFHENNKSCICLYLINYGNIKKKSLFF